MLIFLDPSEAESKKGDFFEDIVSRIFESQRYSIKNRVNFTGMEIDLIATHKDKTETAYIECKARGRLEATDIKVFAFNVNHHSVNCGFFLSTSDFEHQVAGLIDDMKKDTRYPNLNFWGPEKLFELLESAKIIKPFNFDHESYVITKNILAWTYFGIFHILILREHTFPSFFCIIDAKSGDYIKKDETVRKLKDIIKEIKDLEFLPLVSEGIEQKENYLEKKVSGNIEHIIEVQESENWYDYLPASTKYFIGRKDITKELIDFIENVSLKNTTRRVFYIDGKSGWGKSSLITYLRGRNNNKWVRNRFYVFAVDVRSASTSNFVALSFKQLINKAIKTIIYEIHFHTRG